MASLNFADFIELSTIGSSNSELNNIAMGGPVIRASAPSSKASIQSLKIVKSGEEKKPEEECAICMERLFSEEDKEAVVKETAPCEHRYHGKCIEKWLEKHVSCPLCQYKMSQDREPYNVHRVEIRSIIRGQLPIEIFGDA